MRNTNIWLPLALILSMPLALRAQSWFENNPSWTNYIFFGFKGPGVEHMTVTKDTFLGGHPARILLRQFDYEFSTDNTDLRVARQNGDTIWCWNFPAQQYYIHYNFSLGVGDTVRVPLAWGGSAQTTYVIDSTGTMDVGGQALRFQAIRIIYSNSIFFCKTLLVEKIGSINGLCANTAFGGHFFLDEPNSGATDGPEWTFCQFQNDQLLYQSGSAVCEGLVAAPEAGNTSGLRVTPNPFRDAFDIVLPPGQAIAALRLFNISGQIVLQMTRPAETKIHAGDLPPGVYFLEILTADQKVSVFKLAH